MAADVELPAAPWLGHDPERGDLHGFSHDEVRGIVADATAAKNAEIEALRAKVRRLNFEVDAAAIYGDDRDAHYLQAETRAERLAEALREMIELRESTQRGEVHPTRHELDIVKDARALIEQETKPCS